MARLNLVILFVGMAMLASTASAATLDEIEKACSDKWEAITSASYDCTFDTNMSGQGFSMKSNGSAKGEMMHKGAKWLMRMDTKTSMVQTVGGNETKSDTSTTMVCDSDFLYTVSDTAGQKSGIKSKADTWTKMAGGKGFFQYLRDSSDLTVLPDGTVDGKSVYVVEAKAKQAGANVTRYYFDKDSGFALQSVTNGADGKPMSTMKVSNLKQNVSLADDHFIFKAPEGVQIQDMTKQE